MSPEQRDQIRLILDHLIRGAESDFSSRMDIMYAANSARGILRSGYTIKRGLSVMELLATSLIDESIEQISKVAMDVEAFALIKAVVTKFETFQKRKLDSIVQKATGHTRESNQSRAQYQATDRLFEELWSNAHRQLEIHRYSFTRPTSEPSSLHASISGTAPRGVGGRPRAAHWDELWAEISMQLYEGDLQPSKQVDIENAMKDWFASQGIDVGDTPIRDRARALWRRWESSQ